jgi:hypothetical protein
MPSGNHVGTTERTHHTTILKVAEGAFLNLSVAFPTIQDATCAPIC